MIKFRKVIALLVAIIVAVVALQGVFPITNAASSTDNVIWEANTDLILADEEGKVNATFSNNAVSAKYDVYKNIENGSSAYIAELSETGNGDSANFVALKGLINSKTSGFGWLTNKKVLNAISPYLYVGFEYRVMCEEQLPDDTLLTLNAADASNPELLTLAQVNVSDADSWKSYGLTKVMGNQFADVWNSGFLTFNLTSAKGGLSGTQTVEIKNIYLVLKDGDKNTINQALNKISGVENIENFTKGIYIGTGNRKNIFGQFIGYDKKTDLSGKNYTDTYNLGIEYSEKCDLAVSRTLATGSDNSAISDSITVNVKPTMNYNIKTVTATAEDGTVIEAKVVKRNSEYTFNMPPKDVTVTATVVYEEERDIAFLWKCDPGTHNVNPWYSNSGGSWTTVDGGNTSAYQFTIKKNQGVAYVYGLKNQSITVNRYFDTAYFYTSIKLVTESEDRTVKIGVSGSMYYEAVIPEAEEWTQVKIPLNDIATTSEFSSFKIDLTNRQAGDIITVGETVVFNKELEGTIDEAWAQIYDISHYQKSETNTLLGIIGDTEGVIDPWCENASEVGPDGAKIGTVVGWDLAWYYSFQNIAPYILIPKEDKMGLPYFTTFYGEKVINASDYVDTGYMEFFIYSNTDGIEVPFSMESTGHANRIYASFSVIYDKSKAREDGYMRVQIPFTYFADAGLNMDRLSRITIKGYQTSLYCDFFLISSFRFYSNYADVPDPDPIIVPEPEPERELPLELDEKVINAKLDKENKILYVPENTMIWEILSALSFDTNETNVDFFNGKFIDDDETVLDETLDMVLYHRGYYVSQFKVKLITIETTTTNAVTNMGVSDKNTVSVDTNKEEVIVGSEDVTDIKDKTEENIVSETEKATENKVTPKETENEFPWVLIVLVALLAVALVSAAVIIIIKRKNRRTK